MLWQIYFCLLHVLLFVSLSQEVKNSGRSQWKDNFPKKVDQNLIDIDVEREQIDPLGTQWDSWVLETDGSGSGMDTTDDEDLVSGYGSGDVMTPSFMGTDNSLRADAGSDVEINGTNVPVVLCGNNSTGNNIARYQWQSLNDFLDIDAMDAGDVCLKLNVLDFGTYHFRLSVYDARGNSDSDDVQVKVVIGNDLSTPTPCQHLREASRRSWDSSIPRCTEKGYYGPLQCRGHESTGKCWCSDLDGRQIPGTSLGVGNPPDCDNGSNLAPCIFRLVQQSRSTLLGTFVPSCTLDGKFDARQCSGSMCYCVDVESGVQAAGSEVFVPFDPKCYGVNIAYKPVLVDINPDRQVTGSSVDVSVGQVVVEGGIDVMLDVKTDDTGRDDEDGTETMDDDNRTNGEVLKHRPSMLYSMMSQPGIMAAVVAGSVILLLCSILLVMFVIYRLRKKDEGSYMLDESKKMPSYSYQRAPDREFYA